MKLASLFDGIAGFPLAAQRAGIETVWSAEIDEQCRSVSRRHFPDSVQVTDVIAARAMLEVKSRGRFSTQLVRPDIVCGGFPCQDLSVAGRRAGLAGARSGLWFVFRRILGIVRPRWFCIENVPGLLSSNEGRDMRVIADALGKLGYGWAMRVFDAQWCGVPQRRRRVFIVGCLGDRRRACEVLFESNSLPWDSPPSREARARTAACLTAGVAASSGVNRPGRRREDDFNVVSHTLRAEGFDASEDGTGRGTPLIAATLNSGGNSGGFRSEPGEHLVVGTLNAHSKDHGHAMTTQQAAESGHLIPQLSHALTATATATGRLDPNGETFIPVAHPLVTDPRGAGHMQGWNTNFVGSRVGVRRLTPLECERLQGFPDHWTKYGHDGRELSDSARYRMLGNAIAVPCVEWFMRRIAKANRSLN